MNTIHELFAENLKRLRGERSQEAIAELAEIPYRSYQNMEAGAIPQRNNGNLPAVARALGVAEIELFQAPPGAPPLAISPLRARVLEKLRMLQEAQWSHVEALIDGLTAQNRARTAAPAKKPKADPAP